MTELGGVSEQIESAGWALTQTWREVRDRWRDDGARWFEEEIVEPVGVEQRDILGKVDGLSRVLDEAVSFLSRLGAGTGSD